MTKMFNSDDSDANFNDQAGKMISLKRGCTKVRVKYESLIFQFK